MFLSKVLRDKNSSGDEIANVNNYSSMEATARLSQRNIMKLVLERPC